MRGGCLLTVLLATIAVAAAPAFAADQTVTASTTSSSQFSPATVTVSEGDTVTWNNASGVHNVHFDNGSFIQPPSAQPAPWTVSQTFTGTGSFKYYCDVHGAPGGIGMSGTVNVTAAYSRPIGASPTRLSLVPAFKPSTPATQNGSHSPPLTGSSSNPPVPRSSLVAVGAQSLGFARVVVLGQGQCAPFDSTHCHPDVTIRVSVIDVRSGNPTGADYTTPSTRDLTLVGTLPGGASQGAGLRITDLNNKLNTGATFDKPGTTTALPFPVPISCATTADPSVGSTCSVQTTANTLFPGAAVVGKRAIWEFGQFQILDQGANGTPGDSDDQIFETQGVFTP
jgi:plastocyanin